MPKQIFYDGLNLSLKKGTGIQTYTRILLRITRELGYRNGVLYTRPKGMPRKESDREIAFFDADIASNLPPFLRAIATARSLVSALRGVRPQRIPISGNVITQPIENAWAPSDEVYSASSIFDRSRAVFLLTGRLPEVKLPIPVDLFHWTFPMSIKSNARANVYTIHDIIPLRLPYTSLDWKRYYHRAMLKILKEADHIITVSEYSKRDIMTYFGLEESRITNAYQAVNIPQAVLERSDDVLANELAGMFGLELRNYFLFYGSLEPKKNIGRIVQAYLAANIEMPLVFVFARTWLGEEDTRLLDQILEQYESEGVPQKLRRIRRYEYMPYRLLMTMVKGARAVLFPSIYEGFGIPILEGMTCGTPVISSTTSAMPEVAGDAALLVDPYDVDALTKAMKTIAADRDLCTELGSRGLRRAELFSYEAFRDRIDKIYAAHL